jgi:hypothetical protein
MKITLKPIQPPFNPHSSPLPSGYDEHSHGKIHHAIKNGKPSISIRAIDKPWLCNSHNQRVKPIFSGDQLLRLSAPRHHRFQAAQHQIEGAILEAEIPEIGWDFSRICYPLTRVQKNVHVVG